MFAGSLREILHSSSVDIVVVDNYETNIVWMTGVFCEAGNVTKTENFRNQWPNRSKNRGIN
jgi:hypothetical protein